jgi:hypothetical protein
LALDLLKVRHGIGFVLAGFRGSSISTSGVVLGQPDRFLEAGCFALGAGFRFLRCLPALSFLTQGIRQGTKGLRVCRGGITPVTTRGNRGGATSWHLGGVKGVAFMPLVDLCHGYRHPGTTVIATGAPPAFADD